MTELNDRSALSKATRISNPGCYATAAQIAIAPLVPYLGGEPTVFGVSGYSGAGTKPSPKNDVKELTGNLMPYSLTDHIHEREISRRLGVSVSFIPHVAVWFQGIHHTINIPLNKEMTSREIRNLYQDRYAGEALIKVVGEAPLVKNISGKHGLVSFALPSPLNAGDFIWVSLCALVMSVLMPRPHANFYLDETSAISLPRGLIGN